MYDRVVYGGVRDFLHFYWFEWPVFNFADCCLVGGAILTFVNWTAILLPIILNIPQKIRGQERVPGLFVNELFVNEPDK